MKLNKDIILPLIERLISKMDTVDLSHKKECLYDLIQLTDKVLISMVEIHRLDLEHVRKMDRKKPKDPVTQVIDVVSCCTCKDRVPVEQVKEIDIPVKGQAPEDKEEEKEDNIVQEEINKQPVIPSEVVIFDLMKIKDV